jgi:hypothetical protein
LMCRDIFGVYVYANSGKIAEDKKSLQKQASLLYFNF